MAAVKLNLSFEPQIAETLRRRAQETGKPVSRYLSELVEGEARRARDELAAAGYEEVAAEARSFAEEALGLWQEQWRAREEVKEV